MKGTIQNKDNFLKTLANRLGRDEVKTELERPTWKYQPQHKVLQGATQDELVEVLRKQCEVIHTTFVTTTKAELSETVERMINDYSGGPIVTSKDSRFDDFGLTSLLYKKLPAENIDVHEWDYTIGKENIEYAEKANIGIMVSDMTLAESGTAVFLSDKDKGRTISFLPINSIILIPKSTIIPRMTQSAQILREKIKNGEKVASCINYITGPSNSADIELNLVVGVHGPVRATYVIIDDL